jgi:hypothetical protein
MPHGHVRQRIKHDHVLMAFGPWANAPRLTARAWLSIQDRKRPEKDKRSDKKEAKRLKVDDGVCSRSSPDW